MTRFLRLLAFALLFATACAVVMPGMAHAQSSDSTQSCDGQNQHYQSLFGQVGQAKIKAATGVLGLFGAVDIKAQQCLDRIQSMFSTLGTLSDPLSLMWNAVAQQVMQFVNQLCSTALSAVGQLKQFVSSMLGKMCIPMPSLGLGIGGLKLNLPLGSGSCQGIQLFNATGSASGGSTFQAPDYRQVIPQSQ